LVLIHPTLCRDAQGTITLCQLVGLLRTVGDVAYGGAKFLHRRRRPLQCTGLFFGSTGVIRIALSDPCAGGRRIATFSA
jgi:hypothetical protein